MSIWKFVTNLHTDEKQPLSLIAMCSNLRSLHLKLPRHSTQDWVTEEMKTLSSLRWLEEVTIDGAFFLEHLLKYCYSWKNLRSLSLINGAFCDAAAPEINRLVSFRELESVVIANIGVEDFDYPGK